MSTLFPTSITVRVTGGAYTNGVWVPAAATTTTILGSAQPLTAREIQSLEIGRRDIGKIKVYSSSALAVGVIGGTPGDNIVWDGKLWEIIAGSAYLNGLIQHWKYIAEYRGAA